MKRVISMLFPLLFLIGVVQATAGYDRYHYPILPGTAQWAELDSHDAMVRATQIPASVIEAMSTEGLIESCLSYPLNGDMMAYDSLQYGFDAVASQFAGLGELIRRKDTGSKLLKKYKEMDPEGVDPRWELLKKGHYASEFTKIELLLSQYSIQANLTPTEREELLDQVRKKSEGKEKQAEVYGHFGQERTKMIAGRLLEKTGSAGFGKKILEKEQLQDFLRTGTFADDETLREIDEEMEKHIVNRVKEGK